MSGLLPYFYFPGLALPAQIQRRKAVSGCLLVKMAGQLPDLPTYHLPRCLCLVQICGNVRAIYKGIDFGAWVLSHRLSQTELGKAFV